MVSWESPQDCSGAEAMMLTWAVTCIPMPMPETVCRTNLRNKVVPLEVCITFSGRGAGMNITARDHQGRGVLPAVEEVRVADLVVSLSALVCLLSYRYDYVAYYHMIV